MVIMNMLDAKTNLSRLVQAIESGAEPEILIARHGTPVARLVPLEPTAGSTLIGIARGRFTFDPVAFDAADDQIADLFGVPPADQLPRP